MESKTRYEYPDPTPIDVPFGFSYESLADTIGRMVRVETLKNDAKKRHIETFEESQDFDEADAELTSPHEMTDLQEEMPTKWLTEEPPDPPESAAPEAAGGPRADPKPKGEGSDSPSSATAGGT